MTQKKQSITRTHKTMRFTNQRCKIFLNYQHEVISDLFQTPWHTQEEDGQLCQPSIPACRLGCWCYWLCLQFPTERLSTTFLERFLCCVCLSHHCLLCSSCTHSQTSVPQVSRFSSPVESLPEDCLLHLKDTNSSNCPKSKMTQQ